jgi:hypothetical protein
MPYKDPERKREEAKRYRARINADPERLEKKRKYYREYYKTHKHRAIYKAYRLQDRKKNRLHDLDTTWAYPKILSPCVYCGCNPAYGLDRLDNSKGHWSWNTVSCCEFCNNILSDLPVEAKNALAPGLKEAKEKSNGWIIPTKRRKKC